MILATEREEEEWLPGATIIWSSGVVKNAFSKKRELFSVYSLILTFEFNQLFNKLVFFK